MTCVLEIKSPYSRVPREHDPLIDLKDMKIRYENTILFIDDECGRFNSAGSILPLEDSRNVPKGRSSICNFIHEENFLAAQIDLGQRRDFELALTSLRVRASRDCRNILRLEFTCKKYERYEAAHGNADDTIGPKPPRADLTSELPRKFLNLIPR